MNLLDTNKNNDFYAKGYHEYMRLIYIIICDLIHGIKDNNIKINNLQKAIDMNTIDDIYSDVSALLDSYYFVEKKDISSDMYQNDFERIYTWLLGIFTADERTDDEVVGLDSFYHNKAYLDIATISKELIIFILKKVVNKSIIMHQQNSITGEVYQTDYWFCRKLSA